jgi:hypothetical protein
VAEYVFNDFAEAIELTPKLVRILGERQEAGVAEQKSSSQLLRRFFRPHLAGKNPRHGLARDQPVLSRRSAVLWLALRLHGKLLPVR